VNTWTYEELTVHAETEIKRCIELSIAAKKRKDIADWQAWRNYAYGARHLWERITGGYQEGAKDDDYERLYALIPGDMPPELADHTDLIMKILEFVEDETRWTQVQIAAFQRGKIMGMCERAGIRLRK
jgi:hypothetical protein